MFTVWELEQDGKALPSWISAGKMYIRSLRIFPTLHVSKNNQENAAGIKFRVTNTLYWVIGFRNMESINGEDWLYVWVHPSVSCLSAFSYCSWSSQGKNTEVVCHSLLQWTTFCPWDQHTYTLLYIRYITSKDLLCITWDSTQYSGITSMRKDFEKEWIYVYL